MCAGLNCWAFFVVFFGLHESVLKWRSGQKSVVSINESLPALLVKPCENVQRRTSVDRIYLQFMKTISVLIRGVIRVADKQTERKDKQNSGINRLSAQRDEINFLFVCVCVYFVQFFFFFLNFIP